MFNDHFNGITRALVTLFILCLLVGCGGSGGSKRIPDTTESNSSITSMEWYFTNFAPDFLENGITCTLTVALYYDESIAKDDIKSIGLTAPDKTYWSFTLSDRKFFTSSTGEPYFMTGLSSNNPHSLPLAGIWTAEIKLKNGNTSSLQKILFEPGSLEAPTHDYIYTQEDWTFSTNPSQYVASLYRFPSQGYTMQYSVDNGGRISTTGFSTVRSSYLADEPRTFNMYCWLYDENNIYLGYSDMEYSLYDHSSTDLITEDGELLITPASTESSTNDKVDLSKVKYIRIVNWDGAQFAPVSYSRIGYESVSSLIPVN
jgi:hypothetical protein